MRRLLLFVVLALVLTPSAAAMHSLQSSDLIVEATDSTGADVTYSADPGTTCTPASGTHFPISPPAPPTLVSCTFDSDGMPAGSFNVTVQDTTPPAFGPLPDVTDSTSTSSKNVSFTVAAPADVNGVSEPVSVSCTPASGDSFPIGTTPVSCTATDARNNTASAGFNVIVNDTGNPTISVTAPGPTEATGPSGAVVNYTVVADDNSGVPPNVVCSPPSGSIFPITTTPVTCTATDGAGNQASAGASIVVQDTTKPTLSLPANITAEADSIAGKVVTYVATATDLVSGTLPANCTPPSGSSFPIGVTTVNCSATDGSGNTQNGSFTVTITDSTGPVISGISNRDVEANSPTGSIVNYPTPTAIDLVDGPELVSCAPASGTTFPLGRTAVRCSATDGHGNTSRATFNVTVSDTTGPNLIVPAARSVYATTPTGVPNTVSGVVAFLSAPSATDTVDVHPFITNDAPGFIPVGTLTVTFVAHDASGNTTYRSSELVVLPEPPAGTPPLPIPPPPALPADVTGVTVTPLDGAVRIRWKANGRLVEVIRSTSSTRSFMALVDEQVVYKGTASSYVDRGVTNGVEYRYLVRAVDASGNHSAGVAAVVVPRRDLLTTPKDGARLKKAPKLAWRADAEAQYYNAQLLLNGVKVLSAWPVRPSYALRQRWKYSGRKYTLKPGLYTWYVWPGYGQRSAVNYGDLMGSRTFRIVR